MGKMGLAGASLTSALPGAALFYLLLMAFINSQAGMPTALKAVILLLMVLGLLLAVFPLYVLVWYRGQKVVLAKDKPAGSGFAATGAVAATGAMAGGVNESFLDDFSGEGDEVVNEGFSSEMLGYSGENEEAEALEFESADDFGEVESIGSADDDFFVEDGSSTSSADEMLTAEFSDEELSSLMGAEDQAESEEDNFLTGGATDDEFNFEMFDDEDEDKKN